MADEKGSPSGDGSYRQMGGVRHLTVAPAKMQKISKIGEFGLIRRIARMTSKGKGVCLGVGDDCAAVAGSGRGKFQLLTCDPVIEGVHFDSRARPEEIGWKVMCRNLSDIAAMGGIPQWALVSAVLPKGISVGKALGIHRGILKAAGRFGVTVVGGDTACGPGGIQITVTLVGEVEKGKMVTRGGARPGNLVFVTGRLGGSIHGKHLRFIPRLKEARFLAEKIKPSSMMDVSDGLASDLHRLAEQSRVGFEIWAESIPVSRVVKKEGGPRHQALGHALGDGEDYELLFTIPTSASMKLQKEWRKRFRLELTCIGRVTKEKQGIRLIKSERDSSRVKLACKGYHHFG